jgi:hypothetical protein
MSDAASGSRAWQLSCASQPLPLLRLLALQLRPPPGEQAAVAAAAAAAAAAAVAAPVATKAAAASIEPDAAECHACWQPGHRKNSWFCPRYGMSPLKKPTRAERAAAAAAARNSGRARACRVAAPRPPLASSENEDEDEDEDEDTPEDSGDNETVCHRCATPGKLFCCSSCPHAYHRRCLPDDAMPVEIDAWRCPICAGSSAHAGFVGNPQQPPHRGSRGRARKRGAAGDDGTGCGREEGATSARLP